MRFMETMFYKLNSIKETVKEILERDPRTRNSDSFLYLKVLEEASAKDKRVIRDMTVEHFLLNREEYGFPCFESVRRTRQKLQEQFPALAASPKVETFRAENEQAYKAFALGVELDG